MYLTVTLTGWWWVEEAASASLFWFYVILCSLRFTIEFYVYCYYMDFHVSLYFIKYAVCFLLRRFFVRYYFAEFLFFRNINCFIKIENRGFWKLNRCMLSVCIIFIFIVFCLCYFFYNNTCLDVQLRNTLFYLFFFFLIFLLVQLIIQHLNLFQSIMVNRCLFKPVIFLCWLRTM